jgi:hypothetical protein
MYAKYISGNIACNRLFKKFSKNPSILDRITCHKNPGKWVTFMNKLMKNSKHPLWLKLIKLIFLYCVLKKCLINYTTNSIRMSSPSKKLGNSSVKSAETGEWFEFVISGVCGFSLSECNVT